MVLQRFIAKVSRRFGRLNLILPVLSGLFLGIGFLFPEVRFLSWFALVPLFFFLDNITSLKKSFWGGFLAGFIFLGQVMSWGFDTWPLSWLGIDNEILGIGLIFLLWAIFVSFLAIFIGLFALSYRRFGRGRWSILLVPSLWVIFEYLRAWGFGIFFAGQDSLFGPHWTFGNLAYVFAGNPFFRSLASFGGIYLVSFLVVLVNVLIFLLVKKSNKISPFIILVIFLFICLSYFYPIPVSSGEESQILKVAILQTKFPSFLQPTEKTIQERFQIQKDLAARAYQSSPDFNVLVLPENAQFLSQLAAREVLAELSEKDFLVVDSEGMVATLYSSQRGVLSQYKKMLLVPIGDYLPYLIEKPGQAINQKWVSRVTSSRSYQKGEETVLLSDDDNFQGGVLFCSEVLSPVLSRQVTQKGAQILFNLGSLAFADGSQNLDSQTQTMLQFRAAENGRYLVRATNFGNSYMIDPKGGMVEKTANFENQVLSSQVPTFSQKTFYNQFGDWILMLAGFLVLTFLLVRVRIK